MAARLSAKKLPRYTLESRRARCGQPWRGERP